MLARRNTIYVLDKLRCAVHDGREAIARMVVPRRKLHEPEPGSSGDCVGSREADGKVLRQEDLDALPRSISAETET